MTWALSRFRAGDLVQVRSKDEILSTLDEGGRLDGMPFMPEMLQYCGKQFRIGAVAHKTCETARKTFKARRIEKTTHLAGVRCDGSAHGGCEAECNLFWKDDWLKPVGEAGKDHSLRTLGVFKGCKEEVVVENTQLTDENGGDPRYSCQATELYNASQPLAWWNARQYLRDVLSRNRSLTHVIRVLCVNCLRACYQQTPLGYRIFKSIYKSVHNFLMHRDVPEFLGTIDRNRSTPSEQLNISPGERVRIKSKEEIEKTLHVNGENRGLYFDVEMSQYCGSVFTVRRSVKKIVDELTGRMRYMKQPCIMLEGVFCNSEYSENRLMCPRAFPSYWREIWLERVDQEALEIKGNQS
jgi:hypothetical protein